MTELTDNERLEFLRDLDNREDVDVSSYEASFIESALRKRPGCASFSEKQRGVIDRMMEQYG